MNRLTKKDRYNHYYTNEKIYSRTNEFDCYDGSVITKLGQLEDIEDELDTKIVDVSKCLLASKNGFYSKKFYYNIKTQKNEYQIEFNNYAYCYFSEDTNSWWVATINTDYALYLYGKTWALTKEELEK